MRKWLVRIAVVLLLAAGVYALRITVLAPEPVEVEVVHPSMGRVEQTVTNSKAGTVRARRRAKLSPDLGARVVELPVREGERVRRGQVLLRLDDSTLQAQLEKARRELAAAEARHREACLAAEQAERELARHQELADRQIVSRNLLDQLGSRAATSRAGCDAAEAAVSSAEAAIDVIREELRKTVLRAPFDGIVAELSTEVGEWVTPSPPALPVPPVIELIDDSSIYVSAPMNEVDSGRIRPGQPVRMTIDSHPDRSFAGTVTRVAPYVLDVEEQNRTVEIEVDLEDEERARTLLPGTSADVEVILETREGVVRVPTATLLQEDAVLVVEDDRLQHREVEIGLRNWDWTEITSGLDTSDRVVTTLDRVDVQPGIEVEVSGAGEAPAR